MRYIKMPGTDCSVSAISLGTWPFGGGAYWGDQNEQDALSTVQASLDCGINFFDSAMTYGKGASEEILGRALLGKRDKAIVATKAVWEWLHKDKLEAACDASLKRLQTDYIDLYYIHWISADTNLDETIEVMERLQRKGKIRMAGICNFGVKRLTELENNGKLKNFHAHQLPYSLLWRPIEYDVQKLTVDNDMGIICYSPLFQGLLADVYKTIDDVPMGLRGTRLYDCSNRTDTQHNEKGCEKEVFEALAQIRALAQDLKVSMAELSIAWLLEQKGVASVITGARTPAEIIENAKGADLRLSEDVVKELNRITQPIKEIIGDNCDMWMSKKDSRYDL